MSKESKKLISDYFSRDDIEIVSLEIKNEAEEIPIDGGMNVNPTGVRTYTITVHDPKLKKTSASE